MICSPFKTSRIRRYSLLFRRQERVLSSRSFRIAGALPGVRSRLPLVREFLSVNLPQRNDSTEELV
jgi:hypothetical protein